MWWSRPMFCRTSPIGVRPNSPPQMTSVESNSPRRFRSCTSAADGRSTSFVTLSRSLPRSSPGPPWWSQLVW